HWHSPVRRASLAASSRTNAPCTALADRQGRRLRRDLPHVHIIPDNSVPFVPNVIGDRAALVIETGLSTRNGAAVYKVAKKLARAKALYLITTHFHPEHRPRRPSVSGDDLVDPFGRLGEGDRRVRPTARQGVRQDPYERICGGMKKAPGRLSPGPSRPRTIWRVPPGRVE